MRFRVDIIERGWGTKVDEQKFFDSADAAWKFVEDYSTQNRIYK